jgi:teichoic acid transport system permease protein
MTRVDITDDDEFTTSVHVYEPHRTGLPKLRPYFRELLKRRQFAAELSRTSMRAEHTTTFFGQIWLVINPLLLAVVYYVLVMIISGSSGGADFFVHLIAGLFAFYYFSGVLTSGAKSVVSGGRLLMNMSFPKLLLPLSALRTAFFRFLPTLIVYIAFLLFFRMHLHWEMLLASYFFLMLTLFGAGIGMFVGAVQVYFRDMSSFLPYFIRIWLYMSPVLWYAEDPPGSFDQYMNINPLFSTLGGWGDLMARGHIPDLEIWVAAALWAVGALLVGSLFFMSREREFVVRL